MNILQYLGQGYNHFNNNIVCQDNAGAAITQNGRIILALSDGCSSSLHADVASQVCVDSIVTFFTEFNEADFQDDNHLKSALISFVENKMRQASAAFGHYDNSEFYATLLFVVMDKESAVIGHIGDGNILLFENDEIHYFSEGENGAEKNMTYFINMPGAQYHLRIHRINDISRVNNIFLSSDGLQRIFEEIGNSDYSAGVKKLVRLINNNEIQSSAALKDFLENSIDDDIMNIFDDWSVLLMNLDQEMTKDQITDPVILTYPFLLNYVMQHPESEDFIRKDIEKARKMWLANNSDDNLIFSLDNEKKADDISSIDLKFNLFSDDDLLFSSFSDGVLKTENESEHSVFEFGLAENSDKVQNDDKNDTLIKNNKPADFADSDSPASVDYNRHFELQTLNLSFDVDEIIKKSLQRNEELLSFENNPKGLLSEIDVDGVDVSLTSGIKGNLKKFELNVLTKIEERIKRFKQENEKYFDKTKADVFPGDEDESDEQ